MKQQASFILIFIALVAVSFGDCQLLDQLMSRSNQATGPQEKEPASSSFRSMMRDMMSVNVPMLYEMNKNGSSMGINVLSGLVKFEKGDEAARSGLDGPRPMSVRILGIPVFERGRRLRGPQTSQASPELPSPSETESSSSDDEELPIIP